MNASNMQPIGNILPGKEKRMLIVPPDFDQITLTPEEAEYAIYDARCEKYFAEKERQEKARKARELQEALTPFTSDQLAEYVLKNHPDFHVDHQCEKIFHLLCQYFANDPAFEKSGYKLSKGILLSGPVGVGKTELLKIFCKNKRQCFHLISVYEIETLCQKNGVEYFQTFTGMVPGWGNSPEFFYQKSVGWAFDDLGRESVVFDFGNRSDVVNKIIHTRYLNKHRIPFSSQHLTTNLTTDEIESRYDYAVKSRLREMFNYVIIDGKDRR
jgi:DNA replication protein DnaC